MAYFYLYAFRKQNLRNDLAIEVQLLSKDLGITYKEVLAGPSAADKRFKSLTYTLKASWKNPWENLKLKIVMDEDDEILNIACW